MGTYYPSYYWTHPNTYPQAPAPQNKTLPWVVIFSLILASFYTIYLYIQPDFVLAENTACSEEYIQLRLITTKAGRFFMSEFSVNIAGIDYKKKVTSTVTEGEKLDIIFTPSLAPGVYSGDAYFRGTFLGEFTCQVT